MINFVKQLIFKFKIIVILIKFQKKNMKMKVLRIHFQMKNKNISKKNKKFNKMKININLTIQIISIFFIVNKNSVICNMEIKILYKIWINFNNNMKILICVKHIQNLNQKISKNNYKIKNMINK